jgi:hypothetical protein
MAKSKKSLGAAQGADSAGTEAPKRIEPSLRARKPFTPERLGPELRHLLGPAAKGFGFSASDILMAWPDIVGERLAERAYPEKLSRVARGEPGGVLTLRCRGSTALEVQHEIPRIIERMNTFAGRILVGRVKIIQGEVPIRRQTGPAPKAPLGAEAAAKLAQGLAPIENPGLKSALSRLGEAVIRRAKA